MNRRRLRSSYQSHRAGKEIYIGPSHSYSQANYACLIWVAVLAGLSIYDWPREVAGLLLTAAGIMPIILQSLAKRTLYFSDPSIVLGCMWVLAAGLPTLAPFLYLDPIWDRISEGSLTEATLWMYRSWVFFALGYWFVRCISLSPNIGQKPTEVRTQPHANRLRVLVGIVGFGASIAYVVSTGAQAYSHIEGFASTSTLEQIIHELRRLSIIYVALYFHAKSNQHLLSGERYLLYLVLGIYFIIFISAASKGVFIELLAMWFLGRGHGQPSKLGFLRTTFIIIVSLCVVYFVFAWVTAYRVALLEIVIGTKGSIGAALNLQLDTAKQAFFEVFSFSNGANNQYSSSSILDRLAYVTALATLFDITRGQSPYEHAYETFLTPVYALLPRSVFGEKAQFFGSGDFAQLLGWNFGGFSVTLPGGLFWTWGYEGIVIPMLVIGLVIGILTRRASMDGLRALYARILLFSITLYLLNIGQTIQPIIIGSTRIIVLLFILDLILRVTRKQSPNIPARNCGDG